MTSPIDGSFGSLVMSGWIAEAPTGRDEAFLLLTTPDERAPVTMPIVAAALGLGQPGTVAATPAARTSVVIGADGWATLRVPGGGRYARPVGAGWTRIARDRRQVVLCVGAAPMPPRMDPDTYTARYGDRIAIGLVPAS